MQSLIISVIDFNHICIVIRDIPMCIRIVTITTTRTGTQLCTSQIVFLTKTFSAAWPRLENEVYVFLSILWTMLIASLMTTVFCFEKGGNPVHLSTYISSLTPRSHFWFVWIWPSSWNIDRGTAPPRWLIILSMLISSRKHRWPLHVWRPYQGWCSNELLFLCYLLVIPSSSKPWNPVTPDLDMAE